MVVVRFETTHWDGGDEECVSGGYRFCVRAFGKTEERKSICACIPWECYFYVETGRDIKRSDVKALAQTIRTRALYEGRDDSEQRQNPTMSQEFAGVECLLRRSFVGFQERDTGFCKLAFASQRACRRAAGWLARNMPHYRQYEANVDPVVRFFHAHGVHPHGTLVLGATVPVDRDHRLTDCDIEVRASAQKCTSVPTRTSEAVIASFDIECHAANGGFPDANAPHDPVFLICTSFSRLGDCAGSYKRVAVMLGAAAQPPDDTGVHLVCVDSEAALLGAWARLIADERADVLVGYNIWGFDMRYLHRRALVNGGALSPELAGFGRDLAGLVATPLHLAERRIKSGGPHGAEAALLHTPARLQLDLYYYLRRFHPQLESYKLDAVARAFLGRAQSAHDHGDGADGDTETVGGGDAADADDADANGKTGLSIARMQELWTAGDPSAKWEIVRYCVQDAELVTRLLARLTALHTVYEVANACAVTPQSVLFQGEQAKVYSLIVRHANEVGLLCPSDGTAAAASSGHHHLGGGRQQQPQQQQGEEEAAASCASLQGATVLAPRVGAYWRPIACLDFQSLYPSIMMAYNLCHSTLGAPAHLPAVQPAICAAGRTPSEDAAAAGPSGGAPAITPRVVSPEVHRGVLPCLLADLKHKREEAKAEQAAASARGDHYVAAVYNAKQCAYKVSMNSVYGFCGASNGGVLPCLAVAALVTAVGRSMIHAAKECVESGRFPGACVIYGDTDSLMIDFAIDDVQQCVARATQAAEAVTAMFPRPIRLCVDKCYRPFLLFSKKRYVGLYAGGRTADALDCKGLQLVRSDTCPFVKRACHDVVRTLVLDMDVGAALDTARERIRELLAGDVPLQDLVISKSVRVSARSLARDEDGECVKCGGHVVRASTADARDRETARGNVLVRCTACHHVRALPYKNTATPAIRVAIARERLGNGPRAGEAVPFVYVEESGSKKRRTANGASTQSCCDMACDPEQARAEKRRPAFAFYYEHQLRRPLLELLSLVLPDARDPKGGALRETSVEKRLFGEVLRTSRSRSDRQPMITQFCACARNDE